MGSSMPSQLKELVLVTSGGELDGGLELVLPDGTETFAFELISVRDMPDWSDRGVQGARDEKGWPWCLDGSGNTFVVSSSNVVWFWDHETAESTSLGVELRSFDTVLTTASPDVLPPLDDGGNALIGALQRDDYAAAMANIPGQTTAILNKALLIAVLGAPVAVVSAILAEGADKDTRHPYTNLTPLMHAAAEGQLHVVALLVNKGADWRATTARGTTAWRFAVIDDHDDVAAYLASLS